MFHSPRPTPRLLRILTPLALATLAQAQVIITCDQPHATSRETCTLTATHQDGKARKWTWRLKGYPDAGKLLQPLPDGRVKFHTPVTFVDHIYTVVAEERGNPAVTATFHLTTKPKLIKGVAGASDYSLVESLFPGSFTPSLRPFEVLPDGPVRWNSLQSMAFCDDPAMGPLDRCWITVGDDRLQVFKVNGERVLLPEALAGAGWKYECVATLPPGPGKVPEGAPRLVLVRSRPKTATEAQGYQLVALEPGGQLRILDVGTQDGGSPFPFGSLESLALDRQGNLYVRTNEAILKRDLRGRTSVFWRPEGANPSTILETEEITAMTINPATGGLYVATNQILGSITADGELTVFDVDPIGTTRFMAELRKSKPESKSDFEDFLELMCIIGEFNHAIAGLALHGQELIILHGDGLSAFHLDTGRMVRLLSLGPGEEGKLRCGPVAFLNPHLPAESCAQLSDSRLLVITQDGLCMLRQSAPEGKETHVLVELELPSDPLTQVMGDGLQAQPTETKADHRTPAPESKAKVPAPETPWKDLWERSKYAAVEVPAKGEAGIYLPRRPANPGEVYSGQCWLQPFNTGRAQVNLQFTDHQGKVLGYGKAEGITPHEVTGPRRAPTLLRVTGPAPAGTAQVLFYVQVRDGARGEKVVFDGVSFHKKPR